MAQSEELDQNLQARFNGETSSKYRTKATTAKVVSSSALAAAKQAIEELGPATNRLQLLTRADAIWTAKKELGGFNQSR